jgi:hypothetical protein
MEKYKKDISRFLNSEEGKILNADVVKLGVTLGIIGAAISEADVVSAATNAHRNYFQHNASGAHTNISISHILIPGLPSLHLSYSVYVPANSHYSHVAHNSHSSHGSHGSHSSHGSHARGGWC